MIKRQIYSQLRSHLAAKEITLIVGPRQAGKTTLMLALKTEMEEKGKKTLFLNLDIEADKQFCDSQAQLLQKITLDIGGSSGYVFIDEIQRKADAGVFLKGLYDMNLPYKFIVSGSGSVELKENIHESLAGRKRIFELSTLTFTEFVDFRTEYKYEGKIAQLLALDRQLVDILFTEYLNFGGYPRVVLSETIDEKRQVMGELYQSYLERDIRDLGVLKTADFTALVRLMAGQIGSPVNVSELSKTLGVSMITVKNYLWYMEKTFLIHRVTPFFRNYRKEITKMPVYYFYDLGMRNYALGLFDGKRDLDQGGFLFENFVYYAIRQKTSGTSAQIHYWRTTDAAEVDFIINTGSDLMPIEVKYRNIIQPELTRSFLHFLRTYHPQRAYVVHKGERGKKKIEDCDITSLSYRDFLFEKVF